MLKTLHNLYPALVTIAERGGQSFGDLVQQTGIGTYKGLTGPIAEFVLYILIGVYLLLGSFGLGIILTAVIVRLLLLNLTIAQIRMMKVNQYLQPLTKRVQQRYKGDKPEQNKRLMELYAKFKMNPLAGCLGMVIHNKLPLITTHIRYQRNNIHNRINKVRIMEFIRTKGKKEC